jgi:nitroreductase
MPLRQLLIPTPELSSQTPQDLLGARYGRTADFKPEYWNEALDALLGHRSSRSYLPDALPPGTLEVLVAAAQSAPSSSNLQAWSVIAVEDTDRKARLADYAEPNQQILSAPLFLIWLVDLSRLRTIARQNGKEGEGLDYLESFLLGAIDAALAAQNAVVAVDSLGLGSCYIGAIRNRPEEVAKELGLPPETVALFGLTVGVPDPAVKTEIKPRLPQNVVLHREQYQVSAHEPGLEDYDKALREFQTSQSIPVKGWTGVVAQRIADAAALKGRSRLGDILRTLGFKLK